MHASTIFALLAFSLVDAKAVRMRAEGAAAPMLAAAAPMPQASAAAAPPAAAAAAAATTADPTCAQAMILAQGIALNIQDQQQELATANQLMSILSTQPVNAQAYATSRTALLQFVNNGIAIRQSNQLITPAGNKAQAGVATVANAQLTELQLSTSLTAAGTDDVAGNMKIVQTLQGDFSGGIMQNMKNMADAMAGCTTAAVAATAAGGAAVAAPVAVAAPAATGAAGGATKIAEKRAPYAFRA